MRCTSALAAVFASAAGNFSQLQHYWTGEVGAVACHSPCHSPKPATCPCEPLAPLPGQLFLKGNVYLRDNPIMIRLCLGFRGWGAQSIDLVKHTIDDQVAGMAPS